MPESQTPSHPASLPAVPRGASLEWKLPILIAALVLVVVGAATAAAYDTVGYSAEINAAERLRRAGNGFADLIARSAAARTATLARVAQEPLLRHALRSGDLASPDSLRALLLQRLPADTLAVLVAISGAGRLQWSTEPRLESAQLEPIRQRLAQAGAETTNTSRFFTAADSIFYWSILPPSGTGVPDVYLAQRRRVVGSPELERQVAEIMGGEASLYFADDDGRFWVTLTGGVHGPPVDPRVSELGFLEYERNGIEMVARVAEAAGSPWKVIVEQPKRSALRGPIEVIRHMAIVAILLLAAGVAGAWLISRAVTAPLVELTEAANALARGEERTVAVTRRDEIGVLGATFNLMASRMSESRARVAREYAESRALAEQLSASNRQLLRTQQEVVRAADRTERLQEITAALSRARTPQDVSAAVLEQGIAALGAGAGSICLLTDDGTELEVLQSVGYPASVLGQFERMRVDAPLPISEAARTGEAVFIEGADSIRERYPAIADVIAPNVTGAWAALPLRVEDRVVGAMGVSVRARSTIAPEDRTLMLALAQQCAQALDRARLYSAEQLARREAESANEAKSAFLATMSHELRTPLNAIAGYVELLALELRGPVTELQRQDLVRIRRNQQHLLSLINDVLHFAKLNSGQVEHNITEVALSGMLSTLEDLIAPQVASRGLHYRLRDCGCECAALADHEKLQQIVLNLVSNAVKFTEPGGQIEVWCETAADSHPLNGASPRMLNIHVRDTGAGIPRDRLESIFDPFVQVDRRLASVHEGIGLGLAISRELARAMGGELTVQSTPGEGSTFTVWIPGVATPVATPPLV
jgi:signal transduction histidine kinase